MAVLHLSGVTEFDSGGDGGGAEQTQLSVCLQTQQKQSQNTSVAGGKSVLLDLASHRVCLEF